jgi:hypothetical protein
MSIKPKVRVHQRFAVCRNTNDSLENLVKGEQIKILEVFEEEAYYPGTRRCRVSITSPDGHEVRTSSRWYFPDPYLYEKEPE